MTASDVLDVLAQTARAIRLALDDLVDWGPAGTRPGQYFSDLAADEAARRVLESAEFGVLSEESGAHETERDIVVVLDPVDGSTNASRGVPWFATSLCALDRSGALAALVVNQATGQRFGATRGGGAWRDDGDGKRMQVNPSRKTKLSDSLILLSGFPTHHYGWRQFRALGAAALDLCAVATGMSDGYVDCNRDAHGPWDYLGGMLVCQEAGASVVDALGRDLIVREHAEKRTPVAGATPELLDALVTARRKDATEREIAKKG